MEKACSSHKTDLVLGPGFSTYLCKLYNLFESQFSHMQAEKNNDIYLRGFLSIECNNT